MKKQQRNWCRRCLLCLLLLSITLVSSGCWPWEISTPAPQTPPPTETPPQVEDAGQSSPPIEGRLLYARSGHIWLRSGTTAHRLTEGLGQATQPSWSPNGQQIAFVIKDEAHSDIWVMNADGSNAHPVTDNQSAATEYSREFAHSAYWAYQPTWIPPDGERIGYISHSYPQNLSSVMSIYRIRPDGSDEQRYLARGENIESPAWSPNGELLAFTAFTYDKGAQLRYYEPASNAVRTLGEDQEGLERYDPAWSTDGQWIAYAARQNGRTDLWLIPSPLNPLYDTESGSPLRLTEQGMARGPAWAPDDRQIVFIAEQNESFDLWLLELDRDAGQVPQPAKAEQLTQDAHIDATAAPCWAP